MRTLRDLTVSPYIESPYGRVARAGDVVKLFLNQQSNDAFPEFIEGTVVDPITRNDCLNKTTYSIQYDESDIDGVILRTCVVVNVTMVDRCDLLEARFDSLISSTTYADDAAADADADLLSGTLYRTVAGGRTAFIKP